MCTQTFPSRRGVHWEPTPTQQSPGAWAVALCGTTSACYAVENPGTKSHASTALFSREIGSTNHSGSTGPRRNIVTYVQRQQRHDHARASRTTATQYTSSPYHCTSLAISLRYYNGPLCPFCTNNKLLFFHGAHAVSHADTILQYRTQTAVADRRSLLRRIINKSARFSCAHRYTAITHAHNYRCIVMGLGRLLEN